MGLTAVQQSRGQALSIRVLRWQNRNLPLDMWTTPFGTLRRASSPPFPPRPSDRASGRGRRRAVAGDLRGHFPAVHPACGRRGGTGIFRLRGLPRRARPRVLPFPVSPPRHTPTPRASASRAAFRYIPGRSSDDFGELAGLRMWTRRSNWLRPALSFSPSVEGLRRPALRRGRRTSHSVGEVGADAVVPGRTSAGHAAPRARALFMCVGRVKCRHLFRGQRGGIPFAVGRRFRRIRRRGRWRLSAGG